MRRRRRIPRRRGVEVLTCNPSVVDTNAIIFATMPEQLRRC